MARTLDDSALSIAKMFDEDVRQAYGKIGVQLPVLVRNLPRAELLLTDRMKRRDVVRLITGDDRLTSPKSDELARSKGLQYGPTVEGQELPPLGLDVYVGLRRVLTLVVNPDPNFSEATSVDSGIISF